jgi:hypothetical protein
MKIISWTLAAIPTAVALIIGPSRIDACAQSDAPSGQARPPSQTFTQTAQQAGTEPGGWPRIVKQGDLTLSIYQPQVESWKDDQLAATAAVSVRNASSGEMKYGVMHFTARTQLDKPAGQVTLDDYLVTRVEFPSDAANEASYQEALQKWAEGKTRTVDLARLEADVAAAQTRSPRVVPTLRNDPPAIILSTQPAVLVSIDGEPVLRPAEGEPWLKRIINTRALILRDDQDGVYYIALMGGWVVAPFLDSPWRFATTVPAELSRLRDRLAEENKIDPLVGRADENGNAPPQLTPEFVPRIYIVNQPTELLQTAGEPEFAPVEGTRLLYVSNSGNDIFLNTADQSYFIRLSGRWFRSESLDGQWEYVEGTRLPRDFSQIPASSPVARVLVSVPGTSPARESAIEATVPQTATVNRADASIRVDYDGKPQFKPIDGTNLNYATNTHTPVIEVTPDAFYAVENGVWFVSASPQGPWSVATSVPQSIYSIPPTSPLYYTTNVRVYGYTPDVVYEGYTPGYYGAYLSPVGTVVYGTGWAYPAYYGSYWIGQPWSYGCGAGFGWTSGSGWWLSFGVGYGCGYGYPYCAPWYGPVCHGGGHGHGGWNHGWNHNGNVPIASAYGRWGQSVVARSNPSWNRMPGSGIVPARISQVRTAPRADSMNSWGGRVPSQYSGAQRPGGQSFGGNYGQPRTPARMAQGSYAGVQPRGAPQVVPQTNQQFRTPAYWNQQMAARNATMNQVNQVNQFRANNWQRAPSYNMAPQMNRMQGNANVNMFRSQMAAPRTFSAPRMSAPMTGGGRAPMMGGGRR